MATNNDRDLEVAEEYAWTDFDKHHGSFINPAWAREKEAFLAGCAHARAEMQAELAREREKSKALAEALDKVWISSGSGALHACRMWAAEALTKYIEDEK